MVNASLELSVSEFVDLFNQTMEIAYPDVVITGELANFRVSRNRWVYFDLKDEEATLKCFGTVYQLPGPLEEGMMLKVRGQPRLHKLYGFSINIMSIQPAGEGSIKKAANLLRDQLSKEGLFDETRKRILPYPPERIGLITSRQSAAYADFIKVLDARWAGLDIDLIDVQVQGELAPAQITNAITQFNSVSQPPEVLVIIRGGGSAEDLIAFSNEAVTRAVASSRIPTLVAIGHEIDVSLAELAADMRGSTPSNAAELLVPARTASLQELKSLKQQMSRTLNTSLKADMENLEHQGMLMNQSLIKIVHEARFSLAALSNLIEAFNPEAVLRRGYALVRSSHNEILRSSGKLKEGTKVTVQLSRGGFTASVNTINKS